VLRDEGRVISQRRLPPVVQRFCGREPLLDEIRGVFEDDPQAFAAQILQLLPAQAEAPAEIRPGQFGKDFVELAQYG
jgi:hypothetical protein